MGKKFDSDTYKDFKQLRNLLIGKLRDAHNSFCINFFQKHAISK